MNVETSASVDELWLMFFFNTYVVNLLRLKGTGPQVILLSHAGVVLFASVMVLHPELCSTVCTAVHTGSRSDVQLYMLAQGMMFRWRILFAGEHHQRNASGHELSLVTEPPPNDDMPLLMTSADDPSAPPAPKTNGTWQLLQGEQGTLGLVLKNSTLQGKLVSKLNSRGVP
jgi:hypothetical protein